MKLLVLLLALLSVSFTQAQICKFITPNNKLIDLTPLSTSVGYYVGMLWDNAPTTTSLLFNICGNAPICRQLGGNANREAPQSCIFKGQDGSATYSGTYASQTANAYNTGVTLQYSGYNAGTVKLNVNCNETVAAVVVVDCVRTGSTLPTYVHTCTMQSKYACAKDFTVTN